MSVVILSRSRVAWLAAIAAAIGLSMIAVRLPFARSIKGGGRLPFVAGTIGATVVLVLIGDHCLIWTDVDRFRSTASRLATVTDGSGFVRMNQAIALGRIALAHPIMGSGPSPIRCLNLGAMSGANNSFSSSDVTGFIVAFGFVPVVWFSAGVLAMLSSIRTRLRRVQRYALATTGAAILICALGDATLQLPFTGLIAMVTVAAWWPRLRAIERSRSQTDKCPRQAIGAAS